MAAAGQHDRRPELGNHCRLLSNELGKDVGNKIPVARHVKRGNSHGRLTKGGHEFPVAIDIAPPAQGAAEPAPRELSDVNIDVGLCDLSRRGRRIG